MREYVRALSWDLAAILEQLHRSEDRQPQIINEMREQRARYIDESGQV